MNIQTYSHWDIVTNIYKFHINNTFAILQNSYMIKNTFSIYNTKFLCVTFHTMQTFPNATWELNTDNKKIYDLTTVIKTTYSATSYDKVVKLTILCFQWISALIKTIYKMLITLKWLYCETELWHIVINNIACIGD